MPQDSFNLRPKPHVIKFGPQWPVGLWWCHPLPIQYIILYKNVTFIGYDTDRNFLVK
jgi:hypothetical protein